jgi:transcriptional regulator with XRE-family HTH domain
MQSAKYDICERGGVGMFGKRLRELRKEKKLTMKELGKKFNLAESTISGYENENRKPDMDIIKQFADFFETSVDYLLGRTNDPSISKVVTYNSEVETLILESLEGLSEDQIKEVKKHIEYLRWKARHENE